MQELNKQDQLVDEADTKTEQAGADMKTTNTRLKETVTAVLQAFDITSSIASHKVSEPFTCGTLHLILQLDLQYFEQRR